MSDLISRQAAIDVIGNVPDHDDGMVWEALSHAQRDVALLPSAQPFNQGQSRIQSSDCISRQAAIDAVDKRFDDIPMEQTQEILLLRRDLRTLPSAEPERKKGKWIYNSPVTMKCNQCGLVIKDWDWHRFKYCPNCCAKMEVKND